MRIARAEVVNLFGVFNHVVEFKLGDRITIIHGPNGFGKTAILVMLQCILGKQLPKLRRMAFDKITLTFDDSSKLSVERRTVSQREGEREQPVINLHIEFSPASGDHQEFTYESTVDRRMRGFPLELIEQHIPELQRINPAQWLHLPTGRRFDLEDVYEQFGPMLPFSPQSRKPFPAWLTSIWEGFTVRLIEAQRLFSVSDPRRARREPSFGLEPAVSSYSKELAASIQEIQAKYGTSSQELDSTFPARVIQTRPKEAADVEKLKAKLKELDQKRQRIIAAGLLEPQSTLYFDPQTQIDETTKGILALYSEDVEKKLSVFNSIADRVELFKELLNKRYSYKQMEIEVKTGFHLVTGTGGTLLPNDLSSGEQHELVLFYELLFKTKANSLILIDEPELSLHVAWQVEFLQDLARVIRLSSFDAVLATHSPQIINDRWDLAVELKGPGC